MTARYRVVQLVRHTDEGTVHAWAIEDPDGDRHFYGPTLRLAHTLATKWAAEDALRDVRNQFRRIVSKEYPGALGLLIVADAKRELTLQGYEFSEASDGE